jgi:hypothetical protein
MRLRSLVVQILVRRISTTIAPRTQQNCCSPSILRSRLAVSARLSASPQAAEGGLTTSKYATELRPDWRATNRSKTVARWYLECAATDKLENWKDLSVFEVRFWKKIE